MTYEVLFDTEKQFIRVTFYEEIVYSEAMAAVSDVSRKAQELNCPRILSDFRDARFRLTVSDIYELPKAIAAHINTTSFRSAQIERAMVVSKNNILEKFKFFEDITFNNGQTNKLFHDVDEAIEWLLSKKMRSKRLGQSQRSFAISFKPKLISFSRVGLPVSSSQPRY